MHILWCYLSELCCISNTKLCRRIIIIIDPDTPQKRKWKMLKLKWFLIYIKRFLFIKLARRIPPYRWISKRHAYSENQVVRYITKFYLLFCLLGTARNLNVHKTFRSSPLYPLTIFPKILIPDCWTLSFFCTFLFILIDLPDIFIGSLFIWLLFIGSCLSDHSFSI